MTTVALSPVFNGQQFFDNTGKPLAGGKIFTYRSGSTSILQSTYTTAAGGAANTNPIILNSSGRPPQDIWLDTTLAYNMVLTMPDGTTILDTVDNAGSLLPGGGAIAVTNQLVIATAGQTAFTVTNPYTVGSSMTSVFVNGARFNVGRDYLETSPTIITLIVPADLNDEVLISTGTSMSTVGISSDAVSYKASGVNAVTTSVQTKLRDYVSVKDFGAVGDGIVDDTAAIQSAMSAATGAVYAPAGQYKITANIQIMTRLFGDGPTATTFNIFGSGYDGFTLANHSSSIESLGITTNGGYRTSGAGIALSPSKRSQKVRDFKMSNQFVGVQVGDGCVISMIESGEIINCTPTTGVGIQILGGNDTFITHIVMDNAAVEPASGIQIQKTDAVWMTDNDCIHCGNGLAIIPDGSIGQYITWIFGTSNAFDSSNIGSGTFINAKNGASIRGIELVNHWSATNAQYGVSITADSNASTTIDGVKLIGPRILNNGKHGIYVSAPTTKVNNLAILDATISGNSSGASNTYDGIFVDNNQQLFTIRGGKTGASLAFPVSQRNGITIGTGCAGYEIDSIDCTGNATSSMSNSSLANAAGRVRNNFGFATKNEGIVPFTSGVTEILVTHALASTPTIVLANPIDVNIAPLTWWVGTRTTTTFKINFSGLTSGTGTFTWYAEIK